MEISISKGTKTWADNWKLSWPLSTFTQLLTYLALSYLFSLSSLSAAFLFLSLPTLTSTSALPIIIMILLLFFPCGPGKYKE